MKLKFESVSRHGRTEKWLEEVSNVVPTRIVGRVAKEGVEALKSNTPIGESGDTARAWEAKITSKGDVTEVYFVNNAHPEAGVNIARLIDSGHGTINGGYVPPQPYIKESIEPIFKKATEDYIKEMTE